MYGTVTDRRCIIGFKRKCRSHPVTYVSTSFPDVGPPLIRLRLSCSDIDSPCTFSREEKEEKRARF